ncbi:hypothetical protein [Acinetobacter baumannii]|uniref:hypothetical protein n=1 Tax=Acinetobacter baumannii TaxID=470 RepID=UPI00298EE199|nr:hypothetical protein [Acinetobacter baumannii]WPD28622.1 hypothetical protein SD207_13135 [Acinetobacter baumannii]
MNQVEINGGQLSSVLNRKLRITTNEVCELLSIKRDKLGKLMKNDPTFPIGRLCCTNLSLKAYSTI